MKHEVDNNFIQFLSEEMDWNHPQIEFNSLTGQYEYLGMPGSGLTKYLKDACKKYGVTTKITRGIYRSRRDDDHDYYITILRYVR